MGYSSLAQSFIPAAEGNFMYGRGGATIDGITPHHMAAKWTAQQCATYFQKPGLKASSNYTIGYDGSCVCNVDETNRAYTSSSYSNDCRCITIEVGNSTLSPTYEISEAAWNKTVELCVDICRRYNFRMNFTGDKNGSLTAHRMFASTSCPGDYFYGRFPELAQTVNAILDGGQPTPTPTPTPSETKTKYVEANLPLNVRSGPGTNYNVLRTLNDNTMVTVYEESNGWSRIGTGEWVSSQYLKDTADSTSSSKVMTVTANSGLNVRTQPSTSSAIVTTYPKGTRVTIYEITNGWARGVKGWMYAQYLIDDNQPSSSSYKTGRYIVNTAAGLNVRSGPGTNYGIVKTYSNGTAFDCFEVSGSWGRTPSGWVSLDYCTFQY